MLIERQIGWAFNAVAAALLVPSANAILHDQPQPYRVATGVGLVLAILGSLFCTAVAASHESTSARWVGFVLHGLLSLGFTAGNLLCAAQVMHPTWRVLALLAALGPFLVWALVVWRFRREPA